MIPFKQFCEGATLKINPLSIIETITRGKEVYQQLSGNKTVPMARRFPKKS